MLIPKGWKDPVSAPWKEIDVSILTALLWLLFIADEVGPCSLFSFYLSTERYPVPVLKIQIPTHVH